MSNHDCHQRVARNIERNSQTHVATALVKLARQLSVCNVKLTLENAKKRSTFDNLRGNGMVEAPFRPNRLDSKRPSTFDDHLGCF